MPFNFTFNLPLPGITNPFSSPSQPQPDASGSYPPAQTPDVRPLRRRPSSGRFSSPEPLNRKRGWVPATAEPSLATAVNTSSNGYLDTPAKYREMVYGNSNGNEVEEMVAGEYSGRVSLGLLHT